jgi:hypothetical protein
MTRTYLFAASVALLVPPAALADDVPHSGITVGRPFTGGDSPPTTVFAFNGKGQIATDVAEWGLSGTFTISGIPPTATIERAFYITGIWNSWDDPTHSMNFTFAAADYGTVAASVVDFTTTSLDLGGYIVDVTSDVSGDGSYSYTVAPNAQTSAIPNGHLLVVVYSDVSLPMRQIQIGFGGEALQYASSASTIVGVTEGGGTLHLFTQGDQADDSAGTESIEFNGSVILGGPDADIFSGNVADYTSYFALPVTTISGANVVAVTTGGDFFAWQFAALVSPPAPISVEQASWTRIKTQYR